MNDMDTFKELMNRMPSLEVATLEELKTVSIFSKTAAEFGKHLIKASGKLPELLGSQSKQWLEDSQNAMETHIFTEEERGRRAKEEPRSQPEPRSMIHGGKAPSKEPPKWKRLGFDSKAEMEQAEFLANHPEETREVIAEAKKENDVPSKGAVKNKVRFEAERKRRKEAEKRPKPEIILTIEQEQYINTLERVIGLLPTLPPKDWQEKAFARAKGLALIIINRLEGFRDGQRSGSITE